MILYIKLFKIEMHTDIDLESCVLLLGMYKNACYVKTYLGKY